MDQVVIRECVAIEEFDNCIRLQREVFGLPDLEISPRRHLIVSRQAGGWTLGAFAAERLVGFVHHLAAVHGKDGIFGYSHMMAVAKDFQNQGVGAQLKWAQRERALAQGQLFIRWTWDPMQARNAHFNLNRLGVTVNSYAENFYGTDYVTNPGQQNAVPPGIDSDRLFANWQLESLHVNDLAHGSKPAMAARPVSSIAIPADWNQLLKADASRAKEEQLRVRQEFQKAFSAALVCAGFERSLEQSRYLLYERGVLKD